MEKLTAAGRALEQQVPIGFERVEAVARRDEGKVEAREGALAIVAADQVADDVTRARALFSLCEERFL